MRIEIRKDYKNGYTDVEETHRLEINFEVDELLNLKHMSPEGDILSAKIMARLSKELD